MIKCFLLVAIVLCAFSHQGYAQIDTITIKKTFAGTVFKQNGKTLSMPALSKIIARDEVANVDFKNGKSMHNVAMVCAVTGGAIIGFQLGKLVSGTADDADKVLMGAGIAIAAVSFPLDAAGLKKIRRAVRTYNANKLKTAFESRQPQLYLTFSGNAVGLVWKF